ncbi:MAG: DUF3459 domain-containing protein, partial [Candidatus Limnocylindria bacterium]
MTGRNDPANRAAFPVDPGAWDAKLHAFVKRLTALRREHGVFRRGATRVLGADGSAVAYLRSDESAAVVVAVNAGESDATLTFDSDDLPESAGSAAVLFEEAGATATVGEGRLILDLPPRSGAVVRVAT